MCGQTVGRIYIAASYAKTQIPSIPSAVVGQDALYSSPVYQRKDRQPFISLPSSNLKSTINALLRTVGGNWFTRRNLTQTLCINLRQNIIITQLCL